MSIEVRITSSLASFDFGAYDAQVALVMEKKREVKKRRKAFWERERKRVARLFR